jgi:flavin-dependent dehydrogenase
VTSRAAFDRALLAEAVAAGAVHEPVRVRDVALAQDGAVVDLGSRRLVTALVIGADGATSLVRRRLARAFTRAQLSIAAGVYARESTSAHVDLKFSADPPGYLWSFPRPDHLAAGACAPARETTAARLQALTQRWLSSAGLAGAGRLEPYAWPIPTLDAADLAAERPAGSRWMLVGDAAGLVDPITREGIYFALVSGEAAARAVAGASDPAAAYTASLRADVYPELVRAARLKAGFFREPFMRLLVDALRESPSVRAVMADLVAGVQPYATLRRRLIRTFEVGLAWRLFRLRATVSPRAVLPGETVLP